MITDSKKHRKDARKHVFWKAYLRFWILFSVLTIWTSIFCVPIGALLAWPAAAIWARLRSGALFDRLLRQQDALLGLLLGKPPRPVYFCIDSLNVPFGLAVDATEGTLTILKWTGPSNMKKVNIHYSSANMTRVTLKRDDIKSWRATDPGASMVEVMGSTANVNTSDLLAISMKNNQAKAMQQLNTGLVIEVDRLEDHRYFLNMPYETAERWVDLLKRFTDERLPAVPTATEFPKTQEG